MDRSLTEPVDSGGGDILQRTQLRCQAKRYRGDEEDLNTALREHLRSVLNTLDLAPADIESLPEPLREFRGISLRHFKGSLGQGFILNLELAAHQLARLVEKFNSLSPSGSGNSGSGDDSDNESDDGGQDGIVWFAEPPGVISQFLSRKSKLSRVLKEVNSLLAETRGGTSTNAGRGAGQRKGTYCP